MPYCTSPAIFYVVTSHGYHGEGKGYIASPCKRNFPFFLLADRKNLYLMIYGPLTLCEEDGGDGGEAGGDEGAAEGAGSAGEGSNGRASGAGWGDTSFGR